ncbi:hypothetical protein L3Q82_002580 [Scortum barcoo]|uniref:Uncharacterized protein n=1 Tax=Scortum barcoo TaxID=214431 RepID=A0ACB8VTQ1_9TELE|nr:hypothetical protein L3Q82_002580 [Scortum barcoo]
MKRRTSRTVTSPRIGVTRGPTLEPGLGLGLSMASAWWPGPVSLDPTRDPGPGSARNGDAWARLPVGSPPAGRLVGGSFQIQIQIPLLVPQRGNLRCNSSENTQWKIDSYYRDDRSRFPYERRPESSAYVSPGEGDFYYCGGAFGGLLQEVLLLAKICRSNFEADAKKGIEAAWQEESHLNRYMWINKPSKVLSPEYLWQDFKSKNPEIHIIRFSGVVKNYAEIRPNV